MPGTVSDILRDVEECERNSGRVICCNKCGHWTVDMDTVDMDTVSHGIMGCQVWTKLAPEEAAVSNSNVQQVAAAAAGGCSCLLCSASLLQPGR